MFHILNSGMTLQGLNHSSIDFYNYSDKFSVHETKDGSISLRSSNFNELFHSFSGAKKESLEKYINPSELSRFRKKGIVTVLDVCLGMGYNSASLIETLKNEKVYLNLWALEIDKNPLNIALENANFRSNWSTNTIKILNKILKHNTFNNELINAEILWGDARKSINKIPKDIKFDLIYLDPFSPQKCPCLWSEEFLTKLSNKLNDNGWLITYSRAAAIRTSLKNSGLDIKTIIPRDNYKAWSNGTLAFKNNDYESQENKIKLWSNLSKMEEDHLKTLAAIPYRDPSGKSTQPEIISRRNIEQSKSNLKPTSLWKRQWLHTKGY